MTTSTIIIPPYPSQDEAVHNLSGHANSDYPFEMCLLFAMAGLGFLGSIFTFVIVLSQSHLRQMTSAFLLHGCLLDIVQCSFSIPFAIGLHNSSMQHICNPLGTSYIVLMTSSCFNLVAVICCEVYTYGDKLQCHPEDLLNDEKPPVETKGSACCVIFGISIVYIGSIILHLGPTIIGGNFKIGENGNCLFIYNQDKNYVVFLMWIVIVTLAITATVYYLVIFYRTINKHSDVMTMSLIRRSISENVRHEKLASQRQCFLTSLNRAKVLTGAAVLHFVCWYPLFFLITIDPRFQVPVGLYEAFTILGWSNAALEPLLLLIFDRQINLRVMQRLLFQRGRRSHHHPLSVAAAGYYQDQSEIVPMTQQLQLGASSGGAYSSRTTVEQDQDRVGERLGSLTNFHDSHPISKTQTEREISLPPVSSTNSLSVTNYSARIIPATMPALRGGDYTLSDSHRSIGHNTDRSVDAPTLSSLRQGSGWGGRGGPTGSYCEEI